MWKQDINLESEIRGSFTKYYKSISESDKGYLCVMKPQEAIYRDLLCEMQGIPHIPFMEKITTNDDGTWTWYKTQHLPDVIKLENYKFNHLEEMSLSELNLSDSIKDTIRRLSLELRKKDKGIYRCTRLDIVDRNIRTDGTDVFLTDIFCYCDWV